MENKTPEIVGWARIEENSTIVVNLDFNHRNSGPKGTGRFVYKPSDIAYWSILAKLTELTPENPQAILSNWDISDII